MSKQGWGVLESVYKFKWQKRKTKADGCPCSQCNKTFPRGTVMYIKKNAWNNAISKVLCTDCFSKLVAGGD